MVSLIFLAIGIGIALWAVRNVRLVFVRWLLISVGGFFALCGIAYWFGSPQVSADYAPTPDPLVEPIIRESTNDPPPPPTQDGLDATVGSLSSEGTSTKSPTTGEASSVSNPDDLCGGLAGEGISCSARAPLYTDPYRTCEAARKAGAAPLHRHDSGYNPALDRDQDGVACEE